MTIGLPSGSNCNRLLGVTTVLVRGAQQLSVSTIGAVRLRSRRLKFDNCISPALSYSLDLSYAHCRRIMTSSKDSMTSSPTGIRAVVFDLGGVLVSAPKKVWNGIESKLGLERNSILSTYMKTGEYHKAAEKGLMHGPQFEQAFSDFYWKNMDPDYYNPAHGQVMPLYSTYLENDFTVQPMIEVVETVRSYGLKTLLLTNNVYTDNARGSSWVPVDRSLFDHVVESCRVGMRKPDPEIYQHVQGLLDADASGRITPDQVLFCDDLGHNLKSARENVGWKTVRVVESSVHDSIAEVGRLLGLNLRAPVPPGTRPVPRAMALDPQALRGYLNQTILPNMPKSVPLMLREFEHGQSNPTYYVRIGAKELVLRKKPPGQLLPSAHQVEREYQVMKAAGAQGVPVPKVLNLCEDSSVLGTPFYLMDFVGGRVFKDPTLPDMSADERRSVYSAMVNVLAAIHRLDIDRPEIAGFGKRGDYLRRNLSRWVKQYEASKTEQIDAMDKLTGWLSTNIPENEICSLVHGDFRLDNLVFDAKNSKVLAVLDWELSTLGDPLTDLAVCALAHYLPYDFPLLKGLSDRMPQLGLEGIPTVDDLLSQYFAAVGRPRISPAEWSFYLAFVLFRLASILQGVYKRSTQGQSTNVAASQAGYLAKKLAELGWSIASTAGNIQEKASVTLSGNSVTLSGNSVSDGHRQPDMDDAAQNDATPRALRPEAKKIYDDVLHFVNTEILPLEQEFLQHFHDPEQSKKQHPVYEELKKKAKAKGLFNLFVPGKLDKTIGRALSTVEYAHICEVMGRSLFAPLAFNCSAPDTGNMEVLLHYGTEAQKEAWLAPLLEGTIRSCFAMTEPQVASSDATNIESSIVRDGDDYVINGHKWFISGACDPECKICIFMGKTDPSAPRHKQQSMILVPMDTPGLSIVRPMNSFGYTDLPGGHAELVFDNVRVPKDNLLVGEGAGFAIAQGRLGPGRIHHCMRLIGHSERALDLMKQRVIERTAFGKPLVEQGTIRAAIAKSRIEIEQARLLVLKTAHMMDTVGNKVAAPEIAMIKVLVPNMALKVIDRSIQAHGAKGVSQDTPLAAMYVWARNIRLADGPDEVHLESLAKKELKSRL